MQIEQHRVERRSRLRLGPQPPQRRRAIRRRFSPHTKARELCEEDAAVGLVVINDEEPCCRRQRRQSLRARFLDSRQLQLDPKQRTSLRLTFETDLPHHQLD